MSLEESLAFPIAKYLTFLHCQLWPLVLVGLSDTFLRLGQGQVAAALWWWEARFSCSTLAGVACCLIKHRGEQNKMTLFHRFSQRLHFGHLFLQELCGQWELDTNPAPTFSNTANSTSGVPSIAPALLLLSRHEQCRERRALVSNRGGGPGRPRHQHSRRKRTAAAAESGATP